MKTKTNKYKFYYQGMKFEFTATLQKNKAGRFEFVKGDSCEVTDDSVEILNENSHWSLYFFTNMGFEFEFVYPKSVYKDEDWQEDWQFENPKYISVWIFSDLYDKFRASIIENIDYNKVSVKPKGWIEKPMRTLQYEAVQKILSNKKLQDKEIELLKSQNYNDSNLLYYPYYDLGFGNWYARTDYSAIKVDGMLATLKKSDEHNRTTDKIEYCKIEPSNIFLKNGNIFAVLPNKVISGLKENYLQYLNN